MSCRVPEGYWVGAAHVLEERKGKKLHEYAVYDDDGHPIGTVYQFVDIWHTKHGRLIHRTHEAIRWRHRLPSDDLFYRSISADTRRRAIEHLIERLEESRNKK